MSQEKKNEGLLQWFSANISWHCTAMMVTAVHETRVYYFIKLKRSFLEVFKGRTMAFRNKKKRSITTILHHYTITN